MKKFSKRTKAGIKGQLSLQYKDILQLKKDLALGFWLLGFSTVANSLTIIYMLWSYNAGL